MFPDPKTKAILFDFDGILVDSEPYYFQACDRALSEIGLHIDEADYYRDLTQAGLGMEYELELMGIEMSAEAFNDLERKRMSYYHEYCAQGAIRLIPEMVYSVMRLLSVGYQVMIASNTPQPLIQLLFEVNQITPPCPIIGKPVGLRGKPEPDIFIYAAGRANCSPAECLVVEDAAKGLVAAQKIGMPTAHIETPQWQYNTQEVTGDYHFPEHESFIRAVKRIPPKHP